MYDKRGKLKIKKVKKIFENKKLWINSEIIGNS